MIDKPPRAVLAIAARAASDAAQCRVSKPLGRGTVEVTDLDVSFLDYVAEPATDRRVFLDRDRRIAFAVSRSRKVLR
jgi:hypothetical protein